LIKAGDRVREFNFRRPTRSSDETYYIDVADEKGERYKFSMALVNDEWKLPESKLPPWIKSIEKKLEEVIKENAKQ
jgi:hypothetical protein